MNNLYKALGLIFLVALYVFLCIFVVYSCWNNGLVPAIDGVKTITFAEAGWITGFFLLFRDITPRKKEKECMRYTDE
jgi:hypothetical protein